MPEGKEKGDILIVRCKNSWFWLIPLSNDRTSVGLVVDAADFKASGKSPRDVFDETVAATRAVKRRFGAAEMDGDLRVATDFSYRNTRLVSPRVIRVGDASGFIDPVFSSGVLLAMESGRQGARVIDRALNGNRAMTSAMKRYEKENRRRIAIYWQFIEKFYELHFTQLFFQPYNRYRMVCAINAVLAGRTELSFSVWWRLRVFFFLAWLNKHVPVAKRIEVN